MRTLKVKPRSKTPNALPPRPAKPNGVLPYQGNTEPPVVTAIDPTTGMPIYENFSKHQGGNGCHNLISKSAHYTGIGTPNYVPASVYQRGTTPTPLQQPLGYETVTVNLIRQPAGFGFRIVGGTEVCLGYC